jgi:hypothetical protein
MLIKVNLPKQLFSNFFEYLHVFHPENKAYISYSTKLFFLNLKSNFTAIMLNKNDDNLVDTIENKLNLSDSKEENKKPLTINSLKSQILTLDSFQFDQNGNNFSQISAGIMEIMHDMITILPDVIVNEILNLLKFESFIMFVMDDNEEKRFGAYRLFLTLLERSSSMSFLIASSLAKVSSVSSVVSGSATNAPLLISQSQFARSLEQQNWSINKENLIYSMCNQLNQFDQQDERFVEYTISMLLSQPFTFRNIPDGQYLKSMSTKIGARLSYLYLLVSMVYSTRKKFSLCKKCLNFISILLENGIVKVDFLINRAGLLQVLFNLLNFISEQSLLGKQSSECDDIFNDLKQFFCLLTRFLLRCLNENQEIYDNFNYFLNTLISVCYDSANVGYERLNFNLKSIVLQMIQLIMSDINSINTTVNSTESNYNNNATPTAMALAAQSATKAPSKIYSKLIMPLLFKNTSNETLAENSSSSTSAASNNLPTIFDNEANFQRFIVFIVDFIHIIYEKISDKPIVNISNDIDDELSIFTFSVIVNSLSLAIDNSYRSKFVNFLKSYITPIKIQV